MSERKNASNFYLKVKGDTESALEELNFQSLTIVRPSLLLGKRNEFRFGETIAKMFMTIFSFIFIGKIKKHKPIEAITVAKALLGLSKKTAETPPFTGKTQIIQSDEIHQLGMY